eukprot:CAMPEP_0183709966 /NCGR_PEP_ID=MMETSP0737-20130205/5875_1 /TAXON_ID=385413 /ORGANISM="Thalassiosira miniscula, Strain CCMP1093" /LENGTH=667 /DNA_ID=CAMNT_0025938187 /DNA_START=274 /DNA_END=2277 /DNA_ORIENTATION=-
MDQNTNNQNVNLFGSDSDSDSDSDDDAAWANAMRRGGNNDGSGEKNNDLLDTDEDGDDYDYDYDYDYASSEDDCDYNDCGDNDNDDDNDDNSETSWSRWIKCQIECNDPNLVTLKIGANEYSPYDGEWGRLGIQIGKHTHLKEFSFSKPYGTGMEAVDIVQLFRGVAKNTSIRKLVLGDFEYFYDEDVDCQILEHLMPFFRAGQGRFEHLEIWGQMTAHRSVLATALREFDSLKVFVAHGNNYRCHRRVSYGDEARGLMKALVGHHDLNQIVLKGIKIGREFYASLANLLRDPKSRLAVLHLEQNDMRGEDATTLASGLAKNTSLKSLSISFNPHIHIAGWRCIFSKLQASKCMLEELNLNGILFSPGIARSLSALLTNTNSIRMLGLSRMKYVQDTSTLNEGWRAIFDVLRRTSCSLEHIDLHGTQLRDYDIAYLQNSLENNRKLRILQLSCINCINYISMEGWRFFSHVLRSPGSALVELDLLQNRMDDSVMISLANSLSDNKSLAKLKIDFYYNEINGIVCEVGWEAFSNILCKKSTIVDTYHSNHTLETVCEFPPDVGGEAAVVDSLLTLNRECTPNEAARRKIIRTHFHFTNGFSSIQPFVDMELAVRTHAIAWLCRNDINRDGTVSMIDESNRRSILYEIVRVSPGLFEIGRNKKRKRDQS